MTHKDLLAPKELTSIEIRELVDEWIAKGGKVTKCKDSVALNYRSKLDEPIMPSHTLKRNIPAQNKKKKKAVHS